MNVILPLLLLMVPHSTGTEIDEICRKQIEAGGGPGFSVAVIEKGQVTHMAGYGLADIERRIPVKPATAFQVGSVTKQFCAMAVQILEEEGRLSLDDLVSDHLPSFTSERITIRHLLTHTAGIKQFDKNAEPPFAADRLPSSDEIVGLIAKQPHSFEPGERFEYGNLQYILASLIVEAVSGSRFDEFLKRKIFNPLHMENTRLGREGHALPDHAVGYDKKPGQVDWTPAPVSSLRLAAGAGAMTTTVEDLARWAQALQAGRFLSSEGYRKLGTPAVLNDGHPVDYGLGWRLSEYQGRKLIAHGGGTRGFSAYIGWLVDEDLSIIILSNGPKSSGRKMFNRIAAVVLD